MAEFPDPLTPRECDLRDFSFMPLDVVRLRDSGLAAKASGDEFRAAVLLWCASWHQQPAASLPDDDQELANLCGYGRAPKEWKKVRDGALRGFVLCTDGRLYHPAVAEKANEAWQSKQAQRARTEAARKAREEQRQKQQQQQSQGLSQTNGSSVTEVVTESKGQGQGQGQGLDKKPSASSSAKLPTCQTQDVIDLYHEVLPNLPAVRLMTDDRKKAIGKRWQWVLTTTKPDGSRRAWTAEQALAWFRTYFERAKENDFLMGRTPQSGQHANWRCDLDFLMTDRGMKHVIEKTFADEATA